MAAGDWSSDLIKRCRRLNTASLIELGEPVVFGLGTATHVDVQVGDATFWVSRGWDFIRIKGKPHFYMDRFGDYVDLIRAHAKQPKRKKAPSEQVA